MTSRSSLHELKSGMAPVIYTKSFMPGDKQENIPDYDFCHNKFLI